MRILFVSLFIAVATLCSAQHKWQDRSLSDDERITALIKELTIEEKVGLLGSAGIPRLGIKMTGSNEAIHGVVLGGPANESRPHHVTSSFPQGYGLGQTWDRGLLYEFGKQMSIEARSLFQGKDGNTVHAGLVLWAPNADLGRDPRWGRTEECFGEDATLVGELAASVVQGMQGPDPNYWRAASLMKHFLANSNEDERAFSSSNFGDKLWREYYSYGFYKGFTKGGASSYMAAYNKYNGIPCTVHPMLKNIVAKEWGVKGVATTDGGAFSQLVTQHHYFNDLPEAAAACIKNGINRFLDRYTEAVWTALAKKLVTEEEIDQVIRGQVYLLLKLGLLDNPNDTANPYLKIGVETDLEPWAEDKTHQLVRRATNESVVLLKNSGILPLKDESIKKILVIGNRADTVYQDWYGGQWPYFVSPLQGIKSIAAERNIEVEYLANDWGGKAEQAARKADVVIVCVGNHPYGNSPYDEKPAPWGKVSQMSDGREAVDRQSMQLESEDLIRLMYRNNKNTVVVLISSFPYAINWTNDNVPAIIHTSQSSQELGNAIADVIFGKYNPAGRLTQTWPKSIDQLPDMLDYNLENGRTYMYSKERPLYPFGYGLSYTSFAYGGLKATRDGDFLKVEFNIKNTGKVDGDEVAQLYVTIPGDNAIKRLKDFTRVNIKAGAKETVTMQIPLADLRLWDEATSSWKLPNGQYT
ncbi:MAG: glycoside hydrolase family 3 C-terminal domain-containing protein, partial [Bacteroidaceae bacterium]|nr:glycoside hydrolase family 3 C-terminal domain-containing protein [Bacteroidaceae bacterium]